MSVFNDDELSYLTEPGGRRRAAGHRITPERIVSWRIESDAIGQRNARTVA